MTTPRTPRLALAALLAAALAAPAAAASVAESETARLERAAVSAGAPDAATSASYSLRAVAAEAVAASTSTASATRRLGAGYAHLASWPGRVTDLAERGDPSVSSVTLTWSSPGYDGARGALKSGTTYFVRVASFTVPDTFNDHRQADLTVSTAGVAPGALVSAGKTGLLPNTTYWARLWTMDAAGNLSYASNISTFVTLALPVSLQPESFVGVFFTSITAHWVARPASPPDASSKTAAGYLLQASSTNFGAALPGGVTSSSQTPAVALSTLTVSDPGLVVDKTYHLRVGALNWQGVPNWTVLGTTDTKFQVNDPLAADPAFTAVSSRALTANWDRNGNPSDSQYHAEVSTAADFTGVVTATDTYNLFYATAGLNANTTYWFRVYATTRSSNSQFLVFPGTATLAPEPAAAGVPFAGVSATGLSARWLPGGNPLAVSSYTIVLSTDPSFPNAHAGTVALASTRPAGGDPMASFTGLASNSPYYAFVAALNWNGARSDFVALPGTTTFPAPPASLSLAPVHFSSAAAQWNAAGNAVGLTTFTVVLSTVASFPPGGAGDAVASAVPGAAGAQSLAVTGLSANATYHLFVRTEGFAHDSAYAAGGSSATRAAPPAPSGNASDYDPVSASGFTLSWSSGSAAYGYDAAGTTWYAQVSAEADFDPVTAASVTFNLSAAFAGLSPNATYYARVAAFSHHHGTWTFADFGSSATLAAVPLAGAPTSFAQVNFSSITARWNANGNPVGITTYTVVFTTGASWPNSFEGNIVLATAPAGATPAATLDGLYTGTVYRLFVAALNHRGGESAYASLGATRTATSPKTWNAGNGTWQTAGNWSPAGVPQATDAVTIAANAVVTADASAAISFSSLTVGNAAGSVSANLVLSTGIASGGDVFIRRGSTITQGVAELITISGAWTMERGALLTHSVNAAEPLAAQVWIKTGGAFDLQAGATITASHRGYAGGNANGGPGSGPGAGSGSSASSGGGSGAGHGGAGGAGDGGAIGGGSTYDSFADPTDAGSGGGGGDFNSTTNRGGPGGGVVRIVAPTMILAGQIDADGRAGGPGQGGNAARGAGGGGSGGAVNISVDELIGGGTVYALGGDGGTDSDGGDDPGGGGGGGRVALSIGVTGSACLISVSTHGGAAGGGTGDQPGAGGTFSSTAALAAPSLSAVSVTSSAVTWQWTTVTNGETYQLFSATGGAMSPAYDSSTTQFVESELAANTTHSRTVRVSACGASNESAAAEIATLTSTPTAAGNAFLEVWHESMTVTWQAFPDQPQARTSEGYRVEASSTNFGVLSPGGVTHSAQTGAYHQNSASLSSPPMLTNTTYYLRVAGLNWAGAVGPFTAAGSSPTLALAPSLLPQSFVEVSFTSITAHWVARPPSPGSTTAAGYALHASSTNFGSEAPGGVTTASVTYNAALSTLTVSDPALEVDTRYYFRVASLNWAGAATWTPVGSTRTRFQVNDPVPDDPLFTNLTSATIRVHWDGNGNPSDSAYRAEASTASDFTGVVTGTDTYDLFFTTSGLAANATYWFRVQASTRGNASAWTVLGATVTHAPIPVQAGTPFAAVHESSLTVRWDPGLNPAGVSTYSVVLTTGFFYPNDHAGNAVLVATRPAGSDPMATLTGLTPDREYFAFVAAVNWAGAAGEYAYAGSTATFPRPPSVPDFDALHFSSASVSWSVNGNNLGVTEFRAVLSTVAAFPPGGEADVAVDTVPAAGVVALDMTGLALDTTYHLFVRTNGLAHATPYEYAGASATLASPPGASPDAPPYSPVTTTGFTLNWSSGAATEGWNRAGTTYYAQISANAGFSPVLASSRTYNLFAAFTGLSTNATYYARAAAFSHHHGTWTFAGFGSSATLAAVPLAGAPTSFAQVNFSSVTARWGANGNPVGITTYTVVFTTGASWPNSFSGNVVLSTAPAGATPAATPSGLDSGTVYRLFVAALNHRGAESAYASLGATRTLTSPKTWAAGDGTWQTGGNWSPTGVPGPNDAVTIAANATVTADASATISFSSLTVGNSAGTVSAVLILSTGIASGGDVFIRRGSTITLGTASLLTVTGDWTMERGALLNHADNAGGTLSSQVWLAVGGAFDLQAGATIAASHRGYDGGAANGGPGSGPGNGGGSSSSSGGGSGAGHGGAGGAGDGGNIAGGSAYDSFSDPVDAGSGGGGGDNNSGTNTGGAGGGVVRLSAAVLNLNGLIAAEGGQGGPGGAGNANSGAGGGGSGGAVNIVAATLTGGGTVYATGGDGGPDADDADDPGGGGGGGRVAVWITGGGTACDLSISTHGGAAGGGGAGAGSGGTYSSTSAFAAPAGFTGVSPTSASIHWMWSLSAYGKNYQVFSDTGGAMSPLLGPAVTQFNETGLLANTTYTRTVRVTGCGNGADSAAASLATLSSAPAAASVSVLSVGLTSAAVQWTVMPASPQEVSGEGYALEASSTNFGALTPGGVTVTSVTTSRTQNSLTVHAPALEANTTYYFRVAALNWAGAYSSYTALGATSTLAVPPTRLSSDYIFVHTDSATLQWAAMPASPLSLSAEGYILEGSTTNFGAVLPGGAIYSSRTASIEASTLTLTGLDLGTTVYMRVGSLNHNGVPNYATPTPLNLDLSQDLILIDLGSLDPSLFRSTVSVDSVIVTNKGSLPVTYYLSAGTATAGSPWSLSISSGVETAALFGLWNTTQPDPADFTTPLLPSTAPSGGFGGAFAGDQNAVTVPPGQSRRIWFRLWLPSSTGEQTPQTIEVRVQPQFP